jgi:hypothetical protein
LNKKLKLKVIQFTTFDHITGEEHEPMMASSNKDARFIKYSKHSFMLFRTGILPLVDASE